MSGKSIISNAYLEDIGDAIRQKKGTEDTYYPSQMGSAIRSIENVTVDDSLSDTSENPVQNKVITQALQSKCDTETVSALADAVQGLDGDVQGLQTTVQAKADTSTVTALSGTVSSLQTTIQGKADKSYVDDAISHVSIDVDSDFSDTSENPIQNKVITTAFTDAMQTLQNIGYAVDDNGMQIASLQQDKASNQTVTALSGTVSGLQTSKADKSYVDTQLATKASTATATTSTNGLMSSADKSKLDAVGSVVTVSGASPTIMALSGIRYVCGEVTTLDFTPCATGICDMVFTSGSTPTVVTLPNTVKFPGGAFTAEANKTYEINILDGVYGVVMAWT